MALALRVKTLQPKQFSEYAKATKECSGCDPDVPGHVHPSFCKRCKGTRREPLGFVAALEELHASRQAKKPAFVPDDEAGDEELWLEG